MEIAGTYYDGRLSKKCAAVLNKQQDVLMLSSDTGVVNLPIDKTRVASQIGAIPRRITWGTTASFVTMDQTGADALAASLPNAGNDGWINKVEARMSVALACLVMVVVLTGVFAIWGVPLIAEGVARTLPQGVSDQLGNTTLDNIDQILSPSELPEERQDELWYYLIDYGDVNTLEFRKAGRLGANALTLSATTVVITDELVTLAEDDEEILAVYLHELGHARQHHVERTLIQDVAWLVLLSLITGDATGASELVLTVPVALGQMAYSREFEEEADLFAVQSLVEYGVSPLKLATILEKLEASHNAGLESDADESSAGSSPDMDVDDAEQSDRVGEVLFDYFSTHPATRDRIEFIHDFNDGVQAVQDLL